MTHNTPCALCGFTESEHGSAGLSRCSSYESELRPRVYIPEQAQLPDGEAVGRELFKTEDPVGDYLWLEVPDVDWTWTTAYRLVVEPEGFAVAEIRIYPAEPAGDAPPGQWSEDVGRVPRGGLTARRMRQVRVADHRKFSTVIQEKIRDAMGEATYERFIEARSLGDEDRASLIDIATLSPDRATRLSQIAALYVAAVTDGDRSPVVSVAQQLGVSRSSVRDQLHDAREVGLLERSVVGQAGGRLSAKAVALLREIPKEVK